MAGLKLTPAERELFQRELLAHMERLSEEMFSASWHLGLDRWLYRAALVSGSSERERLLTENGTGLFILFYLIKKLDGLFWWPVEADEPQFVSLDEWREANADADQA